MSPILTRRSNDTIWTALHASPRLALSYKCTWGQLLGFAVNAVVARDPDIGLRSLHIITVLTNLARRQLTLCMYL
jgi:hypothetical protein